MKLGLVITTYNRPNDLKQTLESLANSCVPSGHVLEVYIVDYCSTIPQTWQLVSDFVWKDIKIIKIRNDQNHSMFYGLKKGFEYFYNNGFDVIFNLDSDTIVKPYWIGVLMKLYQLFPHHIISVFNTLTHPIVETFPKYHTKKDIGGINMLFGRDFCPMMCECLVDDLWDWRVVQKVHDMFSVFIVARNSVVQHISTSSVAGHNPAHIDRAEDWQK